MNLEETVAGLAAQLAEVTAAVTHIHNVQQQQPQPAPAADVHTHAQVAAATAAHVTAMQSTILKDALKKVAPAKYSGPKSGIQLDDFIFKAGMYFDMLGTPDDQRLAMLPLMLEGDASLFWRVHVHDAPLHQQPRTYTDAIALLQEEFSDLLQQKKARAQLARLKQTGSVADYVRAINKLCLKLPN